jgi:hypothetical protein
MKLFALITFLSMAILAIASDVMGNDWKNAGECARRGPLINKAISNFCDKGDIVIPSGYASYGKQSGGVRVSVTGIHPSVYSHPNW